MSSTPERWLKALIVLLSLSSTTLLFGILILSLVPVKFILKKNHFDKKVKESLYGLARCWIYFNNWIYSGLHNVEWRIICKTNNLKPDGRYLLISNHVSSADILAVFVLASGRLPFPQFFLKKELLFVPVSRSSPRFSGFRFRYSEL